MKLTVQLVNPKNDAIIREGTALIPIKRKAPLVFRVILDKATKKLVEMNELELLTKVITGTIPYIAPILEFEKIIGFEVKLSNILGD